MNPPPPPTALYDGNYRKNFVVAPTIGRKLLTQLFFSTLTRHLLRLHMWQMIGIAGMLVQELVSPTTILSFLG